MERGQIHSLQGKKYREIFVDGKCKTAEQERLFGTCLVYNPL